MKLMIVTVMLALLLTGCSRIFATSSSAGDTKTANKESFATACEKVGGKWTTGGIGGFYGCLKKAPDAGKFCTDDSECTYNCYANKEDEHRIGQQGLGQCQVDNRYRGCNSEIRKGIIQPRFCVKI